MCAHVSIHSGKGKHQLWQRLEAKDANTLDICLTKPVISVYSFVLYHFNGGNIDPEGISLEMKPLCFVILLALSNHACARPPSPSPPPTHTECQRHRQLESQNPISNLNDFSSE